VSRSGVGVLALQGASEPHLARLAALGVDAREVRGPSELAAVSHLVLPGGESTTLHNLLCLFDLWDVLRERHRAGTLALFGTCAGAILLARDAGGKPPTLGLLDAGIQRNAYGRQVDSAVREVTLTAEASEPPRDLPAMFIRAPRFTSVGPEARVLAELQGEPVALEAPGLLATTFHPELGGDDWFHRRFLAFRLEASAAPTLAPRR
jgi:pyridoxal 5'-phosphate synthase pdxT subunit